MFGFIVLVIVESSMLIFVFATLSFSSVIIRSAVFLPMPFAVVKIFASPERIAVDISFGVNAERIASPAFGPIP